MKEKPCIQAVGQKVENLHQNMVLQQRDPIFYINGDLMVHHKETKNKRLLCNTTKS